MIDYTATLQEAHLEELRQHVLPATGREGAAYLLLGRSVVASDPWTTEEGVRFVSREVIRLAEDDLVSSSDAHIRSRTRTFARVLRRAAETDAVVAFVHGHPGGFDRFSAQDDTDEPYLVEVTQNRNGSEAELLSIVLTQTNQAFGRVWHDMRHSTPLSMIRSVGERIRVQFEGRSAAGEVEALRRQALAFGPALNADFAALRLGIVGGGATGSAVAMLLARHGAQHILAIDNDTVEESNLGRLHGATMADVGRGGHPGTPKVLVVKRSREVIGLGAHVAVCKSWVGDPQCRDALKSCDVVFGCTDDNDGRMLLNRLAYFYLIPVIDMGIGIDFVDGDPPKVTHAESRVTVVVPGTRCLACRGVVDPNRAQEEELLRRDPSEYRRRREEGDLYVRGGGRTNPAVVTFTTGVACMAVDELVHRLTGYRTTGSVDHLVRKHHLMEDKRPGGRDGACRLCGVRDYWGRGDMVPFLDRAG